MPPRRERTEPVMPKSPPRLSLRGAQTRLAQEMATGRITRKQFLAGVGALSKAAVGAGKTSFTAAELGLGGPRPAAPRAAPRARTAAAALPRLVSRRRELQNRLRRNRSLIGGLTGFR